MSKAPELSPIGLDQLGEFSLDKFGGLYWHRQRVKTELRLSVIQNIAAALTLFAAVVGGLGSAVQGWVAYQTYHGPH